MFVVILNLKNVFATSLETHPLKGKLEDLQGCSCGCNKHCTSRQDPYMAVLGGSSEILNGSLNCVIGIRIVPIKVFLLA